MTDRPPQPVVTVVVCALNSADTIRAQLIALMQQTYPGVLDIVVSDNGSTDGTQAVVRSLTPSRQRHLRVVDSSQQPGVAGARNIGALAGTGDLIALADSDDLATPTWAAELVKAARVHDVVGGHLVEDEINPAHTARWRAPATPGALPVACSFLPYAVGANTAVWRDVFVRLGGWRAEYKGGGDDIEFSWRAQLEGLSLGYAPDARMHYRHRVSLRATVRQHYKYGQGGAHLYKDFASCGARSRPAREAGRSWLALMAGVPGLVGSRSRARWLIMAAGLLGRARGSVRYQVIYL